MLLVSVPDPDLDPSDPYVFRPLGSGSVVICTDPDPSINKPKIQKTLVFTSVADPCHFGTDPDPRIQVSELMDPDFRH
jgi:hypothetical protein